MKPTFIAKRGVLDKKPGHGKPCNGCGLCCIATICPAGQKVFSRAPYPGPCPALVKNADQTFGCGLVADPMRYAMKQTIIHGVEKMREAALHLIGAGTGCDARFNGEPADQEFYKKLEEHDRRTQSQWREARRLWRMS